MRNLYTKQVKKLANFQVILLLKYDQPMAQGFALPVIQAHKKAPQLTFNYMGFSD